MDQKIVHSLFDMKFHRGDNECCGLIDSLSIILQKDLRNKSSLINMYMWYTYESYIYFNLTNWQFNHVLLHASYYINYM